MGRNRRQGLDYFPFDISLPMDFKIRKLIKYQSGKAVTVYAFLLCIIYREGYYIEWDKELPFILSEMTGFDEAYIQAVIECCLTLGLFNAKMFQAHKVLTARGIQERYQRVCQVGRRVKSIDEYNLLDEEETTELQLPESDSTSPSETSEYDIKIVPETPLQEDEKEKEYREEMNQSPLWLEQMCMRHSVDQDTLAKFIDDFFLDCQCRDKKHTSTQDAKRHFNDWLRITQTDRNFKRNARNARKPNKAVTATAEDFKTSF